MPDSNDLDDIPDYGSVFLLGKTHFDSDKFYIKDDPIVYISTGDEHAGVITESGRIFMFGCNNFGQLGLGHERNVDRPSCVKSLKPEKAQIIACGRNHTIVSTDKGTLYSFGCNSESQLGLGENSAEQSFSTPQKVLVNQNKWKALSAGTSHSCALTEAGDLYVWGCNDSGELGVENTTEVKQPRLLNLGFQINHVACGYYHTAIITKKNQLFTSGSNEFNQLGHDRIDSKFQQVKMVSIETLKTVACGGGHTVVLTESGSVYSFGDGTKGQLGLGQDVQKLNTPKKLSLTIKSKAKYISCGESHTAIITEDGYLYTFGENRYGKLGLDGNDNFYNPSKVEKYNRLNAILVSCGGCHTVVIVNKRKSTGLGFDSIESKSTLKTSDNILKTGTQKKLINDSKLPLEKKKEDHLKDFDSSSDSENNEMENTTASLTFNKTHISTNNTFVPLSEINLKKLNDKENINYNQNRKLQNQNRDTKVEDKNEKNRSALSPSHVSNANDTKEKAKEVWRLY